MRAIIGGVLLLTFVVYHVAEAGPCDGKHNGAMVMDPNHCSKFYHCVWGRGFHKNCSMGTVFSPLHKCCVHKWMYKCVDQPSKPPIDKLHFWCHNNKKPDGDYKHPNRSVCNKFVKCCEGHTAEMDCPAGLHWDDNRKRCEWPWVAKCTLKGFEPPISITDIIEAIKEVTPGTVITNQMIAAIKQIIRGYYGGGCSSLSCNRPQLINRIKNANTSIELSNARLILGNLLNQQGGQGSQLKGLLTAILNSVGQKQFINLVAAGGRVSLAVAFDTTGSMRTEQAAVNQLVTKITSAPRANRTNYILSEFNDPGPQKVQEFTQAGNFASAVSGLTITGGGNCPEKATEGILNALTSKSLRAGSPLVVVTDATANDANGLGYINKEVAIAIANEICSGITFLLTTRTCGISNDPNYVRMLGATGGMKLRFRSRSDVSKVDDLVLAMVDGITIIGCGKSSAPAGRKKRSIILHRSRRAAHEDTFTTDPSVGTLIVQATGQGTIKLKNPSNSEMTPLVTLADGALWVINSAPSGEWKLESSQSFVFKAWAAAATNIGFSQVFLKNLSPCNKQTAIPHPLQEEEATMRLILSRSELLDDTTIKVHVVSEDCMSVLSEAENDGEGIITFDPPSSAFRLRLTATRKTGEKIARYSRMLEAQPIALTPKLTSAVYTLTPDTATPFSFYLFNNKAAETFKIEAFSSVGAAVISVTTPTLAVAEDGQNEGSVSVTFPGSDPAEALYLIIKATGMTSGVSTVMATALVKTEADSVRLKTR